MRVSIPHLLGGIGAFDVVHRDPKLTVVLSPVMDRDYVGMPQGCSDVGFTTFAVATTTFDWLVVSGTTATFSAPVTVNGQAGYRAVVTVTDPGKNDTFRVVVTGAGGSVAYDSGTQAVTGQVVVH